MFPLGVVHPFLRQVAHGGPQCRIPLEQNSLLVTVFVLLQTCES